MEKKRKRKKEEEEKSIGEIAEKYSETPSQYRDTTFGITKEGKNHYYIGKTRVIIKDNDIIISNDGETFKGTPGLWELILEKTPSNYLKEDFENYARLMIKTNVLHRDNNPNNTSPRGSGGDKWVIILKPIWEKYKKERWGKGIVVIPSDPNALLERLDLLLASQEASHTGVGNELVSISDELKRQGVLDTKTY